MEVESKKEHEKIQCRALGESRMRLAIVAALLGCAVTTGALAQGRTTAPVPQYPYPAEPQYQYPPMDPRGQSSIKCPKGQKPYQGVCRKWRRY